METACLRYTELPGTSELFADYQYRFGRVARFYSYPPLEAASYEASAAQIRFSDNRRAALVEALRPRNEGEPSLELLARPDTVAVVTGQQVGLFSGPAYTIYKALTAVRLAKELTAGGIPAVPVFWLAAEDHDAAEVDHCFVFQPGHKPVKLSAGSAGAGDRPVGAIPIGRPPVEELERALEGFPSGGEVAALVRDAYTPGVSYAEGFERLLKALLAGRGMLYLNPLDAAIRKLGAPLLLEAAGRGEELNAKLRERNRELESAGYHAQVHVEANTALLFRLEAGRRIALRLQNGAYTSKERGYSVAELTGDPELLSPNALLRPVMQDYLLPTAAYVGGPAELAYLAQSQVLYKELLGRMPVAVARDAFTVIDRKSAGRMEKFGLRLPDFFGGPGPAAGRIAATLTPPPLRARFAGAGQRQRALLDELRAEVLGFDPSLAKALDKSGAKMRHQLAKLERKVAAEALRRDARARADAESLSDLLYPAKHLQERYYSILPLLAKHGLGLLDTLEANVHADCPDHKMAVI